MEHASFLICLGNWSNVGWGCIGAKQNQYKEITSAGSSCFIGAIKLVHTWGYVGCKDTARSKWGCDSGLIKFGMITTDSMNQILYPPPRVVNTNFDGEQGWHTLPGYTSSSPELVFSHFGYPKYLKKGDQLRVWYGEDLYDYTESDNHRSTCMSTMYTHWRYNNVEVLTYLIVFTYENGSSSALLVIKVVSKTYCVSRVVFIYTLASYKPGPNSDSKIYRKPLSSDSRD